MVFFDFLAVLGRKRWLFLIIDSKRLKQKLLEKLSTKESLLLKRKIEFLSSHLVGFIPFSTVS